MTFELYYEVLITQRSWKEIINIPENSLGGEKMCRASSHRWNDSPKRAQWAKGGTGSGIPESWALATDPETILLGQCLWTFILQVRDVLWGKRRMGRKECTLTFSCNLLAPFVFTNHIYQRLQPISHAGVNCYLTAIENRVLPSKVSTCWKSKYQLTKYRDGENLPPPPHSPTSVKSNGGVWTTGGGNEIMRVHQEKIKCPWQQSWWMCCGHYLLMRLPRRLPLKSWWLWEQAFLHQ